MLLWESKVIALIAMFVIALVCGLVPIWLVAHFRDAATRETTRARMDKALSLLNCVVGGVFLATTLVHLLPEVREITEQYLEEYNIHIEFGLAELTVCTGFFLIMWIEHIVMACQHHHSDVPFDPTNDFLEEKTPILNEGGKRPGYGTQTSETSLMDTDHSRANPGYSPAPGCCKDRSTPNPEGRKTPIPQHVHNLSRTPSRQSSIIADGACVHVIHTDHHSHHHLEPNQLAGVRSFLLLLAMSLHTIFEGLAIGLQTSTTAVWNLFIAVVFHKVIITFSLGVQFAEHLSERRRAVFFICLFVLMSPLGVGIGTVVTEFDKGDAATMDVVEGVLTGVATGTLLYVTFFEVLMAEVGSDHSLLKVFFVLLGFTAMTLLTIFNHE